MKSICEIDSDGTKRWYLNGEFHREDGPAVEYTNGDNIWFFHGKIHRKDGPAVKFANGDTIWFLHGEMHREDGPAIEQTDGIVFWCLHDTEYFFDEWCKAVNISEQNKLLLMLKYG